jgi:hypothetical protein
LPALHAAHADKPVTPANVPTAQVVQVDAMDVLWNRPTPQPTHVLLPVPVWMNPGWQLAQTLAVPVENVPALHVLQTLTPAPEWNLPAAHEVQTDSPVPVPNVPATQLRQDVELVWAGSSLYLPAPQREHANWPSADTHEPLRQSLHVVWATVS